MGMTVEQITKYARESKESMITEYEKRGYINSASTSCNPFIVCPIVQCAKFDKFAGGEEFPTKLLMVFVCLKGILAILVNHTHTLRLV